MVVNLGALASLSRISFSFSSGKHLCVSDLSSFRVCFACNLHAQTAFRNVAARLFTSLPPQRLCRLGQDRIQTIRRLLRTHADIHGTLIRTIPTHPPPGTLRPHPPYLHVLCPRARLSGLYDPDNPLEKLVFLWLAVPWLQAELDEYVQRFNSTSCRADKNEILPHGIPDFITERPERYGTLDFKVCVPSNTFDEAEKTWAPSEEPVFQLVPRDFDNIAQQLYDELGRLPVSSDTFWDVYSALLAAFRELPAMLDYSSAIQSHGLDDAANSNVQLLPNLRELRYGDELIGPDGYCYGGGLTNPPSIPSAGNMESDYEEEESSVSEAEDHRVLAIFTDIRHDSSGGSESELEVERIL